MNDSTYKDLCRLIIWFHCVLLEFLPPDLLNHRIVIEVFSSNGFLGANFLEVMGLVRALGWATNLSVEAMIHLSSFRIILCLPVWLWLFLWLLLRFLFTHHFPIHQPPYFGTSLLSIQLRNFHMISVCSLFLLFTSALFYRQWLFPAFFTFNLALHMFGDTSNQQDPSKSQANDECHCLEVRYLWFLMGFLGARRVVRSLRRRVSESILSITTRRVTKSKEHSNSHGHLNTRNFHLQCVV